MNSNHPPQLKIVHEPTKYHQYAFEFKFSLELLEFCRWIKQTEGWRKFGFLEKKWRFSDAKIIDIIKGRYPQIEIDPSLATIIKRHELEEAKKDLLVQQANELKTRTTSSLVIKGLKGELYPYQKVGVEFFINNQGRAILADTMGLGKTAQALAYLVHEKLDKALVICPASVKYAWESEVLKWTKLKPLVIGSRTDLTTEVFNEHNVFIINYDILKKHFDTLFAIRIDCLIVDEFHYIKSNTAQRTKLVKLLARNINSRLLLSGTPLLSRPVELFNGLQLMDPITWDNWYKFTTRYCQGHQGPWGWDSRGVSNIDELKKNIDHYFLRRTKEEVLPELPPKRFIDFPVELNPEKKFEYELVEGSFVEYLREIKNKTNIEIRRSMQAETLVKLGELRQLTTQGKQEAAYDLINEIVEGGEKVVVFSCYNEPLDLLQEKFGDKAVSVTGQTPELFRKEFINSFQNKESKRIFLGGIKSAGVGITLTAASTVVFIDYSWVPADHWQAVDRCHRIGQQAESITVYQLYSKNTVDEMMKDLLSQKQVIFDKLINNSSGASGESINMIDGLLKEYEKPFVPVQ